MTVAERAAPGTSFDEPDGSAAAPQRARGRRSLRLALLRRLRRGSGAAGRWTWPTALVFALSMGALVLVVEAAILAVLLLAGLKDSSHALQADVDRLMRGLQRDLETELRGVETQAQSLAGLANDGFVDLTRPYTAEPYLRATLSGLDYVTDVGFLRSDGLLAKGSRGADGAVDVSTIQLPPEARDAKLAAMAAETPRWGPVVWVAKAQQALLTYTVPVPASGDRPRSVAFAGITSRALSAVLRDLDTEYSVRAFMLTAGGQVLAYPYLESENFFYTMGERKPLPDAWMLQDPVLDRHLALRHKDPDMRARGDAPGGLLGLPYIRWMLRDSGGNLVEVNGQWMAVIERPSLMLNGERVTLAAYFPADRLELDIQRFVIAFAACALALGVGTVGAALFGWRLARPLRAVSHRMGSIATLDFETIPPLPRSRVRELDTVADAFNRMIHALRWFETYVPRQVVRRLVEDGAGSELPSRTVEAAVMFSDIVGFTTVSEKLTAQETADLLNAHFELLAACVARHGGTVDKFIGDSMMAAWSLEEDAQGNARRAVAAADSIVAAVKADNDRRRARGEDPLCIRLGIHAGPVVLGNIGGGDRMNYTIVGDTVNIAQRLEQMNRELAPEDEAPTVLSAAVVERAAIPHRVASAGFHAVKGREEPVEVFLLQPDPANPAMPCTPTSTA